MTTVEGTESVTKAGTADVGDGAVIGEATLGDAVDSTATLGSRAKIGAGPPPAIANPSGSIDAGVVTDGASGSARFEEPRHELSASAREIERATTLRRIPPVLAHFVRRMSSESPSPTEVESKPTPTRDASRPNPDTPTRDDSKPRSPNPHPKRGPRRLWTKSYAFASAI